eukprot:19652-Rhodomonas_salina.1
MYWVPGHTCIAAGPRPGAAWSLLFCFVFVPLHEVIYKTRPSWYKNKLLYHRTDLCATAKYGLVKFVQRAVVQRCVQYNTELERVDWIEWFKNKTNQNKTEVKERPYYSKSCWGFLFQQGRQAVTGLWNRTRISIPGYDSIGHRGFSGTTSRSSTHSSYPGTEVTQYPVYPVGNPS